MKSFKAVSLCLFLALGLIILWHFITTVILFFTFFFMADRYFGDFRRNEAFLILIPIGYGSVLFGILGLLPAYFSYNFLLKKLTSRFGLQIDRPKRLFALSAFLIYGLPLLLLFWALVKP